MLLRLKAEYNDLVNEILDKIPQNKLIHGKVLDPSMGGGQFMKEIERRKREAGLSLDKIKKTCYGYADGQLALNYVINKHGLVGTYKIGNFLEEDIDMKFDVIVGNPPYDSGGRKNIKLWYKFANKAIQLGNIVAFVTPNAVISDKGINGENLRKLFADNNFGFIDAKNHDIPWFRDVGVKTCHWIIQKNNTNKIDPIILKEQKQKNPLIDSICNKVTSYNKKLIFKSMNGHVKKEDLSIGDREIYFSGDKLSHTNKKIDNGSLKLVFPFSASYHKIFITEKAIGMLNLYLEITTKAEGEKITQYCLSPLFKFVADNYKKTSGFTPFVKNNMIPDLREKKWTDAELYKHFNLTKEEIDLIESSVK